MLILPLRKLLINELFVLVDFSCETPVLMLPLKPSIVFLYNTILINPLIPSGLYFAEGFVISSIDLMAVEGICFKS